MSKILWKAKSKTKLNSNLYKFEKFITKKLIKNMKKFQIENLDRLNKIILYPVSILFLVIFRY